MSKMRRRKPTIVHVSSEETLVVFPIRPGAATGRIGNRPFEEIKHLLVDRPLRRPYGGEAPRTRSGKPSKPRAGKPRRKPRRKPEA